MTVVVSIGDYRRRDMEAIMRELLISASRGRVRGFAFTVEFDNGTEKSGFTGKYRSDAGEAVRVALRMSQHLTEVIGAKAAARSGG